MTQIASTFSFEKKASLPKNAIALIYDLEGFSKFFNIPDIQNYISEYLNTISEALNICIFGGDAYWLKDNDGDEIPLDVKVVHEKYLGDGALYIFVPPEGFDDFDEEEITILMNRLWNLKNHFSKIQKKCYTKTPIADLPNRIRFGIARGSIYELTDSKSQNKEYVGFCINLAARLQSYCRDLGFIASARIGLTEELIEGNGYVKVIAKSIKGFSREIVIVDKKEFDKLQADTKKEMFELLP